MKRKDAMAQRRSGFTFFFGMIPYLSRRQTGQRLTTSPSGGGQRIIPSPSGGGLGWGWRLPVLTLLAALALALALYDGTASANGAVRLVVIDEVAGPYQLRVGVLPGDPTLGPLHVSILIQDADTDRNTAVDDATVSVAAAGPGAPSQTEAVNSPQSPQLYEGNLYLDTLGEWSVTLDIESPLGEARHIFTVEAAAERGFNLMFVIVAVAVVLIVASLMASQVQRRRRLRRGR